MADLYPDRPQESRGTGRAPRPSARDALEVIRHETMICTCVAEQLLAGTASPEDVARTHAAVTRIHRVLGGMR
jgi:hypothetical protein